LSTTNYLASHVAAEELARLLPEKDAKQWHAFLQNNRNPARSAVYRIPFDRLGKMALYEPVELERFVEWEKSRQLGTMKLGSRAAEALQAFGVGETSGSTTGRKLSVVGVTAQHDEATNSVFVQFVVGEPLRVYRLEISEALTLTRQLEEALQDTVALQKIISKDTK